MSVFFIILPLALLLGGGAIAAYVWSVRSGQLDDLDTPAVRVLHDDVPARPPPDAHLREAPELPKGDLTAPRTSR